MLVGGPATAADGFVRLGHGASLKHLFAEKCKRDITSVFTI